jgi:hypothetical protein
MRLNRMLQPWLDTATWNTLVNGVQPDGVEARATPDATIGAGTSAANIPTGVRTIDVLTSVRAFSAGAANRGWALLPLPGGTDGLSFSSSEAATLAQRPKLTITFTPPAVQSAAALTAALPPATSLRLSQRLSLRHERAVIGVIDV